METAIIIGIVGLLAYGVYKLGGLHISLAAASAGGATALSAPPSSSGGVYAQTYTIPVNTVTGAQITSSPDTWPQGDNIWDVCRAIASEEGATTSGSVPDRLNNPGDISDYPSFGQEYHSGSYVTVFPNKDTGWYYLYDKVSNIANGRSAAYSQDSTFYDVGKVWAPTNWESWASNVAAALSIDPGTKLRDYIGV